MIRSLLLLLCLAAPALAQSTDVLYVPDSINDRVLRLDAATGDVLDAALIQDSRLGTIVQAIAGFDGEGILVSDQINDVVWQYTSEGVFVGVFAPVGGADPAVMDNIRGIAISRDGLRLLVTVAGGASEDALVAFDRTGALLAPAVAAAAGGLDSPWGLLERDADLLVGGSGNSSILRYALDGTPLGTFAADVNFPQQIAASRAGGVLVANFSPVATRGFYEYDAAGVLLGTTTLDALLGAPRGVYDLASGNLLVATSAGIYEVTRAGVLVSTKVAGGQYRYITRASRTSTAAAEAPAAGGLAFDAPAPNPARGSVALRLAVPAAATVRVTVLDALGRTVATLHDGPAPAGALTLAFDTQDLPAGVYVVRAAGGDAVAQTRVVVAR